MRRHTAWRALFVVLATASAALTPSATSGAATGPTLPSQDPFYSYSGVTPLSQIAPGTVLAKRAAQLAFGTSAIPVTTEQLLYRTTDQQGNPSVTVTTVIAPLHAAPTSRLLEYLSFYDGLGSQCDPSYTLAGGDPGTSALEEQADEEELLIDWYLAHGDTVTVPDFEGTGLHWMAGRESGYGALDAVRATESYLGAPATTPVALSGYSGGAVAGNWASELAPGYAPELNLVGVAEGGIPANYFDVFHYIDGTTTYSSAMPGILIGLSRAAGVDLTPYLSPYGSTVFAQESQVCIASTFGNYPGLTMKSLLQPAYQSFYDVPVFQSLLGAQTMGTVPGRPTAPLFMAVGKSDATGDGVMVAADVEALAKRYCQLGVSVLFEQYQGFSHETAGAPFEIEADAFLQSRLAGLPVPGNCSTLH